MKASTHSRKSAIRGAGNDPLLLDRQVCFPLYAASNLLTRLYRPVLEPLGLTYPQYLVMLVLWEGDGIMVSELGQRLSLDSGTLTPLLKRMEAAGLVTRARDRADERRVLVSATEQGWALRERVADVPARLVEGMGMSAADGRALRGLLDRLIAELED